MGKIITPATNYNMENANPSLVNFVLNGGTLDDYKTHQFKTNATLLRKDEWKEIDQAVYDVARTRLTAVQDLINNNLIKTLGGLGTLISEYERSTDMSDASINMSPLTVVENDTIGYDLIGVPIPIVQKDFFIDIRRLSASRTRRDSLDTIQAQIAARKVTEASENMVVNGVGFKVDGHSIYGYTSHPDRITGTAEGDFGTITNIYSTVRKMVNALNNKGFYGPFMLYVAPNQFSEMREIYSDGSGDSALMRIKEQFPEIMDIKMLYDLADGNLVMVQMTQDVVDIAIAEDIQTVEWNTMGGLKAFYKVMAAWAPRIKSDANSACGVCHYTGA